MAQDINDYYEALYAEIQAIGTDTINVKRDQREVDIERLKRIFGEIIQHAIDNSGGSGGPTTLETYLESGQRVNSNSKATVGDYDSSGNGTRLDVDDARQRVSVLAKELFIGTADNQSSVFNPTVYQFQQEDPTVGGSVANKVYRIERTANPSGTGVYYGDLRDVRNTSNDNETGTVGLNIAVSKRGTMDSAYLYGSDFTVSFRGGGDTGFLNGHVIRLNAEGTLPGTVSTIMRGISANVKVDNPNVFVSVVQGMHPTVELLQGTVGDSQVLFLDFDIANTANLIFQGDLAYIQGGGGGDVIAAKAKLEAAGHKLRFFWNQGTAESDTDGIINYLGDVSEIEAATEKVLINKEYGDKYYKGLSFTVANLPAGSLGDRAIVTDATVPTYLGALVGGGTVTCPAFHNGTQWVSN
jgi:hypothetical protein